MARAALAAFRKAGYDVGYWQSELDRDNVPDMTVGDLSTVATGCRNILLGRKDPMCVMLDLHFNGPESTLFSIVPDNVGLRSGYADGAPADDTAANNTLDMKVAQTLSAEVSKQLGGKTLYKGRLGVPGVMSERETGVALSGGWRLGMFGGTAIVRHRAVRLVVEFGGYNDFTRYSNYANKCAAGMVNAINKVFGGASTPAPKPTKPSEKNVTIRFDVLLRTSPGFWDKEKNESNVVTLIKAGTKATVIDGPRTEDGVVFYDIKGDFGTGWVQDQVLHVLEFAE